MSLEGGREGRKEQATEPHDIHAQLIQTSPTPTPSLSLSPPHPLYLFIYCNSKSLTLHTTMSHFNVISSPSMHIHEIKILAVAQEKGDEVCLAECVTFPDQRIF